MIAKEYISRTQGSYHKDTKEVTNKSIFQISHLKFGI